MSWNEKLVSLRGDTSIEMVCDVTNISPNTYEAYELGERIPEESVKELIAEFFGVSVSDIW